MKLSNVLIMVVIGAFLYMEGHLFMAKGIVALAVLGAVTTAVIGRGKNSKKDKKKTKNPGVEMLDPIEIDSVRKPPYRIPKKMQMKVSPNKKASESFTSLAIKASPLGLAGKWMGKKLKNGNGDD